VPNADTPQKPEKVDLDPRALTFDGAAGGLSSGHGVAVPVDVDKDG